jgi:hypothetical protein
VSLLKLVGLCDSEFNDWKVRTSNLDLTSLDPDVIPLVIAINSMPGLTTGWSCSGHNPNSNGHLEDPGYLTIIVQQSNLEAFEALLNDLSLGIFVSGEAMNTASVEYRLLYSLFTGDPYPTWTIRWNHVNELETFRKLVENCAKGFKPKLKISSNIGNNWHRQIPSRLN